MIVMQKPMSRASGGKPGIGGGGGVVTSSMVKVADAAPYEGPEHASANLHLT